MGKRLNVAILLQVLLALAVIVVPLPGLSCEEAGDGPVPAVTPTPRITPVITGPLPSLTPAVAVPTRTPSPPPTRTLSPSPTRVAPPRTPPAPSPVPTLTLADATGKTSLAMENRDLYVNVIVARGTGGEGGWSPKEEIRVRSALGPGEQDWARALVEQGPFLVVADDQGNWESTWFLNGQVAGGRYEVYIQGTNHFALFSAVSDRQRFPAITGAAITPINVVPMVRASVTRGPPGGTVQLAGNGLEWWSSDRFSLDFGDGGLADPAYPGPRLKTIPVPRVGSQVLWSPSFTVPEGPAGKYALIINPDKVLAGYFEITGTLRLSPPRAAAGATVEITGSGFKAGAPVTISLKGPKDTVVLGTTPGTLVSNGSGQVSGKVTMPADGRPGEALQLVAADGQGTATAVFTVTRVATPPAPVTPPPALPTPPVIAPGELPNPKLALQPERQTGEVALALMVDPYPLPLNLDEIVNLKKTEAEFRVLNPGQKELLRNNGFVVTPGSGNDIVEPYKTLKLRDVPVFVTSDTLLHLYHMQFNEILKRLEEEDFFDQLIDLSLAMLNDSIKSYQSFSDPDLKEAARRNVAYFAVALGLLQRPTEGYDEARLKEEIERWNRERRGPPKEFKPLTVVAYSIPDYVSKEVAAETGNIESHQGFAASAIFNSPGVKDPYREDYSQYVPRGHYTRSEALKRFFKAMMWYGRMAFFLKGGSNALVSEQDARLATLQASLIAAQLPSVKAGGGLALDIWNRIYAVTSFFVGAADDLTPYEYLDAMKKVLGRNVEVVQLTNDEKLLDLKVELSRTRNPEIYGGSGVAVIAPPFTKEKLDEVLAKTKGLRFMGQRYVPDSYLFQNLVFPAVGRFSGEGMPFTAKETIAGKIRGFPRGLDFMAVLGSSRALEILKAEGDTSYGSGDSSYEKQLTALRSQFGTFRPAEWTRNIYWGWLYSLIPLLEDFGKGYPSFMQTPAWRDKELSTALSSWAELRRDTILFAKQSYTMMPDSMPPQPKPVVGYVEPVPRFYSRMRALTTMTKNGLARLNALKESEKQRLESLEAILGRLTTISLNELETLELTDDDYAFIRNFGENLDKIVAGIDTEGKETTMIADVHTDTNAPPQVLEEGVGYVDLMFVAYKVPDGRIILGAGPVFSYYEFKQPLAQRLTDEAWKEMLKKSPDRPNWVSSFVAK